MSPSASSRVTHGAVLSVEFAALRDRVGAPPEGIALFDGAGGCGGTAPCA